MSKEEKVTPPGPTEPAQTDDDADIRLQINLRLRLDEVAEVEATAQRSLGPVPTQSELCQLACRMYDARRTRDRMLARELFGEPAWDMLLALYCLPSRGIDLTVTGLTYSADVPQSTGHRWQRILHKEGLVERLPQEVDRRRQTLQLTEKGRALMEAYLRRLYYIEVRSGRDSGGADG